MSKLLKTILISLYASLLIQFLRKSLMDKSEEIVNLNYVFKAPKKWKIKYRELLKQRKNISVKDIQTIFPYNKPIRLPTDIKYILKWTEAFSHYSSSVFQNGQGAFIDSNCEYINCYMTTNKYLLMDVRNFDVILFDVENNWDNHPFLRAPHQKFIFTASESADYFPICHKDFELYYNWTWTYKLDSTISWTFLTIIDKEGKVIGPKINMTWIDSMKPTPKDVRTRLLTKKKAAAWFVSNCNSKSKREKITKNLMNALKKYNLQIDVFGWCGHLTCGRDRMADCLELLETDYYFYLSFENSLCEDYVTEKILYPLQHYTVPIVYGGANYSRFLPPGSYIDAGLLDAEKLAAEMNTAIKNPAIYQNYFRWHNYYVYRDTPDVPDICKLCEMMNNPKHKYSIITHFRQWWNKDYNKECEISKNNPKFFTS